MGSSSTFVFFITDSATIRFWKLKLVSDFHRLTLFNRILLRKLVFIFFLPGFIHFDWSMKSMLNHFLI